MARQKRSNPPSTWRRALTDTSSGMPTDRHERKTTVDPLALHFGSMDSVLLDPQRLYDATWCSPAEFDYMLHLYEGWLELNSQQHLFCSEDADGRADRDAIHPRHALLMMLADKKANVPTNMLAELFGTDRISTYLSITDAALTEVLSGTVVGGIAGGPGETKYDTSGEELTTFNLFTPAALPDDPIRLWTAKNYPGLLLPPGQNQNDNRQEDVDAAERRVEEARASRMHLSAEERVKQYRRLTDPFAGSAEDLDGETAMVMKLENFHKTWDQTRLKNASLLWTLAKKRVRWGGLLPKRRVIDQNHRSYPKKPIQIDT